MKCLAHMMYGLIPMPQTIQESGIIEHGTLTI